jgi:hypothetical protein
MHNHPMTSERPRALSDELEAYYTPGNDRYWCSDYEGKQRLCSAVGIEFWYGDDHDQIVLGLLRTLPPQLRWVVEMRTGVWCGDGLDGSWSNWAWVGGNVGVDALGCKALFDAGIALLRAEAVARDMDVAAQSPRSSRQQPWRTASDYQRNRFDVLKRDAYRCQICGASAEEGARLEVDHRQSIARGGSSRKENLWTLCQDCNRGKGTEEL